MHDKRAEKTKRHFDITLDSGKFKVLNPIRTEDRVPLLAKVGG